MEDHLSCHLLWPMGELTEQYLHISRGYPVITPNHVSLFGMFLAFPAARLTYASSLTVRRIGIGLFVVRLWIDGIDGIVFRMQKLMGADKHTQQSIRLSSGWWVDFVCDYVSGILFVYAIYAYLRNNLSKLQQVSGLPITTCPPAGFPSKTQSPGFGKYSFPVTLQSF